MNKSENIGLGQVTNHEIPQAYTDLFQISPELREKMKGKSLALIFFESTLMSLELSNERGKLALKSKRSSLEHMEEVIEKKIASYIRTVKDLALPILEGIATVCSSLSIPFLGGFAPVLRAYEGNLEKKHQSELTRFEHDYKGEELLVNQYRESQRESQQSYDKMLDLWRQQVQQEQEAVRTAAAAAAA